LKGKAMSNFEANLRNIDRVLTCAKENSEELLKLAAALENPSDDMEKILFHVHHGFVSLIIETLQHAEKEAGEEWPDTERVH
tara:strand:+ start:513 stop:758 length:246 start_codon:yes stop_codon:yes gene_type:complete